LASVLRVKATSLPPKAKVDINSNIVGFYNSERLNSVLGNLSPAVFERNMAENILSVCPKLVDHYSMMPDGNTETGYEMSTTSQTSIVGATFGHYLPFNV
jgi:hypothetical protein